MNSLLEVLKERALDKRRESQTEKDSLLDFLRKRDAELETRSERERLLALARKEISE